MSRSVLACLALFVASAIPGHGQAKYSGPVPPKPDTPYLLHASTLVPLEAADAKEEQRKDDIAYQVPGAESSVKTPLASPIFLFDSQKITPEQLELYRVEAKNGRREIVFSKKKRDKNPQSLRLSIQRVTSNLYRIEVVQSLENGDYCLTPNGSNQVFCFQEF
jgi:hypothetical protein